MTRSRQSPRSWEWFVVVPALTAPLVCQRLPGARAAMVLGPMAALSPFVVRLPGHLQHPTFSVEPAINVVATAVWFALVAAVGAIAAAGSVALVTRFQPGRAVYVVVRPAMVSIT